MRFNFDVLAKKIAENFIITKLSYRFLCVIGHTVSSPELRNILLFAQIASKEAANQYKLFVGF